jgi:hypothetical protein
MPVRNGHFGIYTTGCELQKGTIGILGRYKKLPLGASFRRN